MRSQSDSYEMFGQTLALPTFWSGAARALDVFGVRGWSARQVFPDDSAAISSDYRAVELELAGALEDVERELGLGASSTVENHNWGTIAVALEQLEKSRSGTAERILSLTEDRLRASRRREEETLKDAFRRDRLGLTVAGVALIAGMVSGAWLMWSGNGLLGLCVELTPFAFVFFAAMRSPIVGWRSRT